VRQKAAGGRHGGPRLPACRVLIPLATPCLYGLERAVIETFDILRPEVTPQFVQSHAVLRRRPPIIEELERRELQLFLLPDGEGWPRLARGRSARHLLQMLLAFVKGNWYYAHVVRQSDALYVTSAYAALFTLAAAVRCRVAGKPVVHHFHELANRRLPRIWSSLVTDCLHNTAFGRDAAIAVDDGLRRKQHAVLPCIVDVSHHLAGNGPLEGNGRQNIVFAGQVAFHKGIDLLIEAFTRIAARHPDAVLHIVGGCEELYLPAFRSMCEQSAAADQIKYWGYRADAPAFFRDAYICVQSTPPSRCAESFGRTVVEAMAFGVPTVCLRSGGLAEIVLDGETGLICSETADSLAAGIDRYLEDRTFRDECGSGALRRYRECYSPEVVRPLWVRFFDGLGSMA